MSAGRPIFPRRACRRQRAGARRGGSLLEQRAHRVSNLDFSNRAGPCLLNFVEDIRCQHVTSDDCQIRRRFVNGRFLNHVPNFVHPCFNLFSIDHAKARDRFAFDFKNCDDRSVILLINVQQLLERGRLRIDDVVAEHHGEWFVADQIARLQHSMAQPQRFLLSHITYTGHIRDRAHRRELFSFPPLLKKLFQFEGNVKVILNRGLAASGNDDH